MTMPKWIYFAHWRLIFRISENRNICGFPVTVIFLETKERRARAFEKIRQALDLIAHLAPGKFSAMQADVGRILIFGDGINGGTYNHLLRKVELWMSYTLDSKTTPEALACLLIHEAQHARLCRLGFGYGEEIRGRVERFCFRAQRNFASLLPDNDDLVESAGAWMEADLELNFSNEALLKRKLDFLKKYRMPRWLLRLAEWLHHRRVRMAEQERNAGSLS